MSVGLLILLAIVGAVSSCPRKRIHPRQLPDRPAQTRRFGGSTPTKGVTHPHSHVPPASDSCTATAPQALPSTPDQICTALAGLAQDAISKRLDC